MLHNKSQPKLTHPLNKAKNIQGGVGYLTVYYTARTSKGGGVKG